MLRMFEIDPFTGVLCPTAEPDANGPWCCVTVQSKHPPDRALHKAALYAGDALPVVWWPAVAHPRILSPLGSLLRGAHH